MVPAARQPVEPRSHESPRALALKADIDRLDGQIRQGSATHVDGTPVNNGAGITASSSVPGVPAPLSAEIMKALNDNMGVDPLGGAQLQNAVSKYTALRSEIGSSRVDLDTAQAAFSRRYQVIAPAQAPMAPYKPSGPKIVGIGLLAALILSLVVLVRAQSRRGKIVEPWQVHNVDLPLLAELRLPPGPSD
jgi:hypothetical protein